MQSFGGNACVKFLAAFMQYLGYEPHSLTWRYGIFSHTSPFMQSLLIRFCSPFLLWGMVYAQPAVLDKTSLLADLSQLQAHLQATYAGALIPGHQMPSLQPYIDSLEATLPEGEMPPHAYVWLMREAVFQTRDVHIYLMKTPPVEVPDTSKWRLVPFRFGIFGDQLQCCVKTEDGQLWPGDTILSINGIPADEIRYKLSHYYPTDYPKSVNMGIGLTNSRPQWLFFRVFGGQDYTAVVIQKGAEKRTIRVKSMKKEIPASPPALPDRFEKRDVEGMSFPLWYDHRKDIVYLKISQTYFRTSQTSEYIALRTFLDATHPQSLIIDLRGLLGGNLAHAQMMAASLSGRPNALLQYMPHDSLADKRLQAFRDFTAKSGQKLFTAAVDGNLIRYVCNPKVKGPYPGKISVLCDGNTASTAAFTATWLNYFCRARIIGSETGGSNYACTTIDNNPTLETLTLSASQIQVHVPSGATIFFTEPGERISGLKPHIAVTPTAKDIAAGKDPVLDAALND